jgi:hypothetical protein
MTSIDRALYAKAVDRFLSDINEVQAETGKKVICDAKMSEFRRKIAYVQGAGVSPGGTEMMLYVKKTGQHAPTEIIHGILDVPISGFTTEPSL